jgi:hypothetical protein
MVDYYQCFGETFFCPEKGGSSHFFNAGNHLSIYMAPIPGYHHHRLKGSTVKTVPTI